MKILNIGAYYRNYPYAAEVGFVNTLKDMHHDVDILDLKGKIFNNNTINDIRNVLGFGKWELIIENGCGNKDVDLVKNAYKVLLFAEEIRLPEYQQKLSGIGKYYNKIYSTVESTLSLIMQVAGTNNVSFLPQALDVRRYYPITYKKEHDISFVGNITGKHENRARLIDYLRKNGINIYYKTTYDLKEQIEIYNKSKLVLNLGLQIPGRHPFEGNGCYTQRVFEVMGCEACVVTNEIQGKSLFESDKEIVYYSPENVVDKIKWALADDKWKKIAQRGYNRCLSDHLYSHRVNTILNDYNNFAKGLLNV